MIHYYFYAFVCLLSCILLYICDSAIYVIVIVDMCDFYFALSICHIICDAHLLLLPLLSFEANELCYSYSCLTHIL